MFSFTSPQYAPESFEMFAHRGTGRVLTSISSEQNGRIRFQGTDWPARLYNPKLATVKLEPETPVQVVGRQGITLLVVTS